MMPAWFARLMLRLLRVRVIDRNKGNWPKKYVLPVVTHTSNRDFWYGVYSRAILGEYINFVGKSSLFKGPLGVFLKWMGGVPVVREKRTNFVDSVAGIFKERDEFRLCLAVEGTRSKVDHFKTGFYFIAKEAGVPLILCKFDFGNEGVIEFSEPYHLTDDIRADFDFIYRYFEGCIGLVPENSFEYDPKVLDLLPKE
ncbi:MAG: 1-acyl-sn-glycerol-3-phosphate acyltransferase [Lewinella sp.]